MNELLDLRLAQRTDLKNSRGIKGCLLIPVQTRRNNKRTPWVTCYLTLHPLNELYALILLSYLIKAIEHDKTITRLKLGVKPLLRWRPGNVTDRCTYKFGELYLRSSTYSLRLFSQIEQYRQRLGMHHPIVERPSMRGER